MNWFTFGKVITKIKRANFLLRHSVVRKTHVKKYNKTILKKR